MKHFDLGEYKQALDDFKNGYRAKEDPVFLYNIAQCYRALDEKADAVRYYRLYLSRQPDASNRAEVEQKIATLQAAIAASPPEKQQGAAPPPPNTTTTTQAAKTSSNALVATPSSPSSPPQQPTYKKWWLWTIVGVAAAGVGVGVGLGFGLNSNKTSGTTFPTASFQ